MIVKELIEKLLDCPMSAEVTVLVEMDRDSIKKRMDEYEGYKYPIDDDIGVEDVHLFGDHYVRIYLVEVK